MSDGLLNDLEFCHATIAVLVKRLGGDVEVTAKDLASVVNGSVDESVDNGVILLEARRD